ncbi:GTPase [Methylophilus methylotrophus]|uniref:GTPase n=1 Tax=Methylophilus methylotrophus TaxID=17 RepID=UPI000F597B12|nr:GTPase [Methylophilus methylotrophus]
MEWTTALSLSARTAKMGYDNISTIQKYWTVFKAKLDLGETQIVVTGHSGAGKSILTAQIHGSARNLYYELPGESLTTEVEAISIGEWTKLVRVLPGQKSRRIKGEINTFENNKSLEGVIHLVDFGYVSPRDSTSAQILIDKDKLDTIEKLRERNLKLEIQNLKDVLNDIHKLYHKHQRPKWLLIAVNKVDLYLDQKDKALAHYHPDGISEFSKTLSEFQSILGKQNFAIYVSNVCAHEDNFEWNNYIEPSKLKKQEQNTILRSFSETLTHITAIHS